jgi:hypothetical protein
LAKLIDPKEFGLPARTVIEEIGKDRLVLVINRKSRIIMADGSRILAKAVKIKAARPGCQLTLRTTAPVCSKTIGFLAEEGIEVVS